MNLPRLAVESWITHGDQTRLCERRRDDPPPGPAASAIEVRTSERLQAIDGFGFALTGGSAELIHRLASDRRRALLQELFSDAGIGVSVLRVSIGASDLSRRSFSYADRPPGKNPGLSGFDLAAGDVEVVPVLKQILAVNPRLTLVATPWSAPPWMKTNASFVGGSLRHTHYQAYADYIVAYIRAMRDHGIEIHAITPQNEPLNGKNEPSMEMTAAEQAEFIGRHLGPALRAANLDVALFCHDHNCDRPDFPLAVLADRDARPFVSGVAWHLYAGTADALSEVGRRHPDLKMYLTEQWVGADGRFADDLVWHMKNVVVGTLRNGGHAVIEWNLAGDPAHGPHTPGGADSCVGALTVDGESIVRNVSYYVIAHLARFVPPGSVRVRSTDLDGLPNVAFETPRGHAVLVVLNDSGRDRSFDIRCNARSATVALTAGAVATCVWPTGAPAAMA